MVAGFPLIASNIMEVDSKATSKDPMTRRLSHDAVLASWHHDTKPVRAYVLKRSRWCREGLLLRLEVCREVSRARCGTPKQVRPHLTTPKVAKVLTLEDPVNKTDVTMLQ